MKNTLVGPVLSVLNFIKALNLYRILQLIILFIHSESYRKNQKKFIVLFLKELVYLWAGTPEAKSTFSILPFLSLVYYKASKIYSNIIHRGPNFATNENDGFDICAGVATANKRRYMGKGTLLSIAGQLLRVRTNMGRKPDYIQ